MFATFRGTLQRKYGNDTGYIHLDRWPLVKGCEVVQEVAEMVEREKERPRRLIMKKAIVFSLMFLMLGIVAPTAAEAKTNTSVSASELQVYGQRRGRNWNRGRVRTVTRTRIVWRSGRRYRETYRITYLPNGRTRIQVISRARLGGYRRY